MTTRGTPLAQIAKAHTDLATSNVQCYAARTDGRKFVKISAFNLTNQTVSITVGPDVIEILQANEGIILDDIETGQTLGVTPSADPTSGTFYITAYVDD